MKYQDELSIKRRVMNYLIKSIESSDFDIRKITFDSISKNLKGIEPKKIEGALSRLERDEEIIIKKSNLNLFIPSSLKKHKNIEPYKLGNPLKEFLYIYIIGFSSVVALSLFSLQPNQSVAMQNDLMIIIGNGFFFGFFIPVLFGTAIYSVYVKIYKTIEKRSGRFSINRGTLITVFSTIFLSALVYSVMVFSQMVVFDMTALYTSMGFGLALGIAIWEKILKKKDNGKEKR